MRNYSEDSLVQQTVINHFKYKLKWETAYAYNTEVFGDNGTLGRTSEKEVVLVRYLKQALQKLNPNLPDSAYQNAINKIVENNISKTLLSHLIIAAYTVLIKIEKYIIPFKFHFRFLLRVKFSNYG